MPDVVVGAVTFSFPDEVFRKPGLPASRQQALAWAAQSAPLPPTPNRVLAVFPDRVLRRLGRPTGGATVPPQLFPTVVPLFGWRGYQPAWLALRRLPTGDIWYTALGTQTSNTVRLEWEPTYPDRLFPPRPLAWHLASAINLDPIPNPPSPESAWQPEYPDLVWPLVRLKPAWQQAVGPDPRIMPPSPDLAWQGEAPDWVARRTLPVAHMPSVSYIERVANIAPDLGLNWQAKLPDGLPRPRRPMVEQYQRPTEVPVSPVVWLADRQDPPDAPRRLPWVDLGGQAPMGGLIAIGVRMAWQADWPTPVRPLGPIPPFGVGPIFVGPVAPVVDEWCITIDDEVGYQPVLAAQAVFVPTLADQAVIPPTLADEEVC